jgi:hypothetical protein
MAVEQTEFLWEHISNKKFLVSVSCRQQNFKRLLTHKISNITPKHKKIKFFLNLSYLPCAENLSFRLEIIEDKAYLEVIFLLPSRSFFSALDF